jgi:hypothetical protein
LKQLLLGGGTLLSTDRCQRPTSKLSAEEPLIDGRRGGGLDFHTSFDCQEGIVSSELNQFKSLSVCLVRDVCDLEER